MEACPELAILKRLETGDVPDEESDALWRHVDTCDTCVQHLERFRREDFDSRVIRSAVREAVFDTRTHADPTASTVEVDSRMLPPAGADADVYSWDIPDYDRVRMCGSGAFGTVWAVRDRVGLHRALKTIDLSRLKSANVQCRESTALETYCRRVRRHPNLIQIFHVGMRGTALYYTMELADDDGTRRPVHDKLPRDYRPLTLRSVIRKGALSPDTAIEVVLRLLRGLSRLHETGLAHRDIKPANIVFVDHQPKLADIGMLTANTAGPSQVGTPEYMPPDRKMDETADVFAMGRVLFEMLVGPDAKGFPVLPVEVFDGGMHWDIKRVADVITKACANEAGDRYAAADRMVEALEACRLLSFDSLFEGLPARADTPAHLSGRHDRVRVLIAAINALPWLAGAVVVLVLIKQFL